MLSSDSTEILVGWIIKYTNSPYGVLRLKSVISSIPINSLVDFFCFSFFFSFYNLHSNNCCFNIKKLQAYLIKFNMLVASNCMVKKAYTAVITIADINHNWDKANTEIRNPIPIITMSFNSHSHSVTLAFRLSGYIYIIYSSPILFVFLKVSVQ